VIEEHLEVLRRGPGVLGLRRERVAAEQEDFARVCKSASQRTWQDASSMSARLRALPFAPKKLPANSAE